MLSDSLQAQAQAIADAYHPPHTGRPSAIADMPAVAKLLTAVREGNYLETACQVAGLHKVTVYDWKKRGESGEEPYKTFVNALEKAAAEAECEAIGNVRKAGKLPQFWAAEMTYLERRHPERWGRRSEGSNEPRVVVQIGVKDSDVQVTIAAQSECINDLSPDSAQHLPQLSTGQVDILCPISSVPLPEATANADPPATSGARSPEGPSPVRPRVSRGRAALGKSRLAGGKEKKA